MARRLPLYATCARGTEELLREELEELGAARVIEEAAGDAAPFRRQPLQDSGREIAEVGIVAGKRRGLRHHASSAKRSPVNCQRCCG